jgi:hypothetical protein
MDNLLTEIIKPGSFESLNHWYPKALNAQIHPLVSFFLNLTPDRIINRYCHLNPLVDKDKLMDVLAYQPKYFHHAGADLFHVTDAQGNRKMVVIETNSSPSGQKSMPLLDENLEQGGYRRYMENTFYRVVKGKRLKQKGRLAVIYDKNYMEASGYAAAMADVFGEEIFLAPFFRQDPNPPVRFVDKLMEVRDENGDWHPIRAAFRYVTQKPWDRIPVNSRTVIFNPIIACLAGGRNKMMAAKAYDFYNAEIEHFGLSIRTPETIWDVHKNEIPLWVKKLGGQAVVKIPYGNAGQGVYTIVNQKELDAFMKLEFDYDMFIVQSLIGNYHWSSTTSNGKYYHVGTMPNNKNNSYVADIRMIISSFEEGLRPTAIYARRAQMPLVDHLENGADSWGILGTNLSIKLDDGTFSSDSSRLVMMDRRDFNKLGISADDLIEGYIQTVLSLIAIDKMSQTLVSQKGQFRTRLFKSLNDDDSLIKEIIV